MKKLMRALLWITFAMYCMVLLYLLLLNRPYPYVRAPLAEYFRHAVNLIPFKTIIELFTRNAQRSINPNTVYNNAVGNFLLFLPMGIYLPSVCPDTRKIGRFLRLVFLVVLMVETMQLLLRIGSFDVDDILLNVAGAAAGYGIWRTAGAQKLLRYMQWVR